jgi:phosphatidylethanolamine/phosphatidyl-N-methylethanolamine N-methyltransferase
MSSASIELYQHLAPLYDVFYGALLQPGRKRAVERLAPRDGERILEVGVGTGVGLRTYPARCRVVAVDLSAQMIARADARRRRLGLRHVSLCLMDASRLGFDDGRFDAVYAPYVINVVADPVRTCREMMRVCRPGGRIVLLNHFDGIFDGIGGTAIGASRTVGRIAARLTGVNWSLGLSALLEETGLVLQSIEHVNLGQVSSVVVCRV